jgi:hypothetical protein
MPRKKGLLLALLERLNLDNRNAVELRSTQFPWN